MKIGIISDTHSFFDSTIEKHFSDVDEIWHAGDIGQENVISHLEKLAKVKAVYGNIDSHKIRIVHPENQIMEVAGAKILMTHIAGAFGSYSSRLREIIQKEKPHILVCGHSHITKVAFDKRFNLLYINPGAAGKHGFHKVRTIIKMEIKNGKPQNMFVVELGKRSG